MFRNGHEIAIFCLTFSWFQKIYNKLCHVTLRVIKHPKATKANQEFGKCDSFESGHTFSVVIDWHVWLVNKPTTLSHAYVYEN